ncbi:MFS transporter [Curtobacterium sp. MCPF17_052]|uniref:MFS transporter n=1 Tax=Curtobacterium sp. MCPF17_052 TaxID=2175655 RepID=UPI0024DF7B03|nr:MFS transporter [Curtobacterium sp. MCPF17_052]WIB11580.1 MFS transporter [Curtobacterium sp. MCPF17_052]
MTTTNPLPPSTDTAPVSARRLNAISLVLVLGALTTLLDTTIVNIALDHLHRVFHAPVADTQWIATGYLLAYVSVIPVSGWLSERIGARSTWMVAVGLFTVGSLLCGLAWSLPSLVVFRVLQGLGAGLVLPVTITILTRAAGRERIGRAIATIGLIGQLAPILGPIIGGSIVQSISWHWLFFVNVPICVAALVLAPRYLPATTGQRGHRFDLLGFVLLTPGVALVAFGVSQLTGTEGFRAVQAWLPPHGRRGAPRGVRPHRAPSRDAGPGRRPCVRPAQFRPVERHHVRRRVLDVRADVPPAALVPAGPRRQRAPDGAAAHPAGTRHDGLHRAQPQDVRPDRPAGRRGGRRRAAHARHRPVRHGRCQRGSRSCCWPRSSSRASGWVRRRSR